MSQELIRREYTPQTAKELKFKVSRVNIPDTKEILENLAGVEKKKVLIKKCRCGAVLCTAPLIDPEYACSTIDAEVEDQDEAYKIRQARGW